MKPKALPLSPDECRGKILAYLYEVNKKARGVKSSEKKFTEIRTEMKILGLSQSQVASELNFLKDNEWIVETRRSRPFRTPGGTVRDSESVTYRISAKGVQEFEQNSKFDAPPPVPSVHVSNTSGTVIVGNGNHVSFQQGVALTELDKFLAAVMESQSLTDDEKTDIEADVYSLKTQLSKSNPNSSIISSIWDGVERVAMIPDLIQFGTLVASALTALGHWPK